MFLYAAFTLLADHPFSSAFLLKADLLSAVETRTAKGWACWVCRRVLVVFVVEQHERVSSRCCFRIVVEEVTDTWVAVDFIWIVEVHIVFAHGVACYANGYSFFACVLDSDKASLEWSWSPARNQWFLWSRRNEFCEYPVSTVAIIVVAHDVATAAPARCSLLCKGH